MLWRHTGIMGKMPMLRWLHRLQDDLSQVFQRFFEERAKVDLVAGSTQGSVEYMDGFVHFQPPDQLFEFVRGFQLAVH